MKLNLKEILKDTAFFSQMTEEVFCILELNDKISDLAE